MMSDQCVFTIGHSNHSFEHFSRLLHGAAIATVVDVRSSPYSRYNPQYNRETLTDALRLIGIRYVFLGRELGARSDDPTCYKEGRVSYERLSQTELFISGLEKVKAEIATSRVALMCAEKEPLDCHRALLVSKGLVNRGIDVAHILADGLLEPHSATMNRLLLLLGLPERDLFRTWEEIVEEASAKQEVRIAYRKGEVSDAAEVAR